jgi:hypothetical protein
MLITSKKFEIYKLRYIISENDGNEKKESVPKFLQVYPYPSS